jgi:hypothetical protein
MEEVEETPPGYPCALDGYRVREDYSVDPYEGYFRSPFAFGFREDFGTSGERACPGVEIEGAKKAYPSAS